MVRESRPMRKWCAILIALLVLGGLFGPIQQKAVAAPSQATPAFGTTIWLKASANGRYVSADLNKASYAPLYANRTSASTWEQFVVVDAGGGYIALRSNATGKYVSADLNRGTALVADRTSIGTWEQFTWINNSDGTISLRARANNLYVCADLNKTDAPLVADRSAINTWEKFTWGAVGSAPPTATPSGGTWQLVWSDEFNGSTINTSNWNFEVGGHGWGNNELQYYTNGQNAYISNGALVIEARKESGGYTCWYGACQYTSSRLTTQNKRFWRYGKIEARMALPSGQGLWPAFWMLGVNFPTVGWPKCGEIDIMEHINTEPKIYGTIHWDNNGYASYGGSTSLSTFTSYHVYSIEWDASAIRWYVDGVKYHEANIANSINGTDEFHREFFIILNLAVGGNWPGSPDSSTPFPARVYVDYVRVYQRQ